MADSPANLLQEVVLNFLIDLGAAQRRTFICHDVFPSPGYTNCCHWR